MDFKYLLTYTLIEGLIVFSLFPFGVTIYRITIGYNTLPESWPILLFDTTIAAFGFYFLKEIKPRLCIRIKRTTQ